MLHTHVEHIRQGGDRTALAGANWIVVRPTSSTVSLRPGQPGPDVGAPDSAWPAAVRRALVGLIALAVLALGACGSGGGSVPEAVAATFDQQGQRIAYLGDTGAESVVERDLDAAIESADALGVDLRIVVSGESFDLVDAKAVTSDYGGTAITYKAGHDTFKTHSVEVTGDQLKRARDAATRQAELGASARSFVSVLEQEGLERRGGGPIRLLLWILFALAATFLVWQALKYRKITRRNKRRRAQFEKRKASLQEWVGLLTEDVNDLIGSQNRLGLNERRTLDSVRSQVGDAQQAVSSAKKIGDLDANEIRVARAAMKLRTLRSSLN